MISSQYLKNEERYGKTIDGVPLSFQEFFQIRQTYQTYQPIMLKRSHGVVLGRRVKVFT